MAVCTARDNKTNVTSGLKAGHLSKCAEERHLEPGFHMDTGKHMQLAQTCQILSQRANVSPRQPDLLKAQKQSILAFRAADFVQLHSVPKIPLAQNQQRNSLKGHAYQVHHDTLLAASLNLYHKNGNNIRILLLTISTPELTICTGNCTVV